MLLKIGVFKNFTNFKRKHLCWSLFLIRLRPFNTFFYRTPPVTASNSVKLHNNEYLELCYLQKLQTKFISKQFVNFSVSHCVKSVQMRSYFWSVFSCIRTEYGPEIIPYLDTFHMVLLRDKQEKI